MTVNIFTAMNYCCIFHGRVGVMVPETKSWSLTLSGEWMSTNRAGREVIIESNVCVFSMVGKWSRKCAKIRN